MNDIEDKTNWPPEVIDALRVRAFAIELIYKAHRDTTKTGDVIITSERHRTQTMNLQDAWDKLFEFVKNIVELPGETSLMSIDRKEKLYVPTQ